MTRLHHKLMNILFFEDYIKYRPCLKKIKEGTSGEYAYLHVEQFSACILQKPFQKLTLMNSSMQMRLARLQDIRCPI